MKYTFDTEGVMRPLERDDAPIGGNATLEELQKLMRKSVPFAKTPRKKGIKLWSIGSEYKQLPKPGSAYIGGDDALSMILIFDERSEVAFSSVKGDIDSVRYVRYHSFGLESGALLAMAYTTEHPAHFFILLATDLEKLASGNITGYDRSTLCLWDEVGSGTSMSARPPTARLRPRALHLPRILPRRELPDTQTYKPHEWLFGQGRGGDEYYIAPIRLSSARYEVFPFDTQESPNMQSELIPWPYYSNATYDMPPSQASIYHVDSEGRTHYYEAFVDGYNSTDWCFFGLHQWEYPISVGQMEKPLRERLVSMDNPVVRELNSLCENGELRKSRIQKIVKPQDTRPEKGSFKGALGGRFGTLGLEFGKRTVETYGTVFLRDDLYDTIALFPVFDALVAAVYAKDSENLGRVLILRPDEKKTRASEGSSPGSAYTGGDGSLFMTLIFGERGQVAYYSFKGETGWVRYVRYYAFGSHSGALLGMAYGDEGPAHFCILLEIGRVPIVHDGSSGYNAHILALWDEVSSGTTAYKNAKLPTERLNPRGMRPPKLGAREGHLNMSERISHFKRKQWLFGQGRSGDEYFIAPIRSPSRYWASPVDFEKALEQEYEVIPWPYFSTNIFNRPPSQASIYHVDSEGRTHYYEAFVDGYNSTDWCFFGLHQWEYPISVGQMEKPLRERLVSMDNPVVRELNSLCEEGKLYAKNVSKEVGIEDLKPEEGFYEGSVGESSRILGLELTGSRVKTHGTLLSQQGYDTVAYFPVFNALVVAAYEGRPQGEGEVLILRQDEGRVPEGRAGSPLRVGRMDWENIINFNKSMLKNWDTKW
ncbi:hypothetical protein FOZ60_001864 [Perkinsus olseni]|uniref:Uncharacterized protein n=2 Tax=Perkinsus olseni TaxID=32597 RepID=A0A7J6PKB9_PEROL|nr:hypothetical protein FOZ60_001864 [Perkinsus olseni]